MKRLFGIAVLSSAVLAASAEPTLQEFFDYPNGALTNVAAGLWNWHSGSGGTLTLDAVNGRAFVNQADAHSGGDDYSRSIGLSLDPTADNSSVLFAGFTVNFSALPFSSGTATAGSYFAHFKSSAANEFYARIGANQEGAASGSFRLAISNEAWDTARTFEHPLDLSLNTDYRIVVRLDLSTDQSTLWINPVDENSTSVTATDAFSFATGTIGQFALRQGTSGSSPNVGAPGSLYIDDLRVGADFQSATIPEPGGVFALAGLVLLGWTYARRRG